MDFGVLFSKETPTEFLLQISEVKTCKHYKEKKICLTETKKECTEHLSNLSNMHPFPLCLMHMTHIWQHIYNWCKSHSEKCVRDPKIELDPL